MQHWLKWTGTQPVHQRWEHNVQFPFFSTCAHSAVNIWTQLPPTVKYRVVGDARNCGRSWTVVLVSALQLPPYLHLLKKCKHLSSTKCCCGGTCISVWHPSDTTAKHLCFKHRKCLWFSKMQTYCTYPCRLNNINKKQYFCSAAMLRSWLSVVADFIF